MQKANVSDDKAKMDKVVNEETSRAFAVQGLCIEGEPSVVRCQCRWKEESVPLQLPQAAFENRRGWKSLGAPSPNLRENCSFYFSFFNPTHFTSSNMGNSDYINQLNEYQKEAVTAEDKYLQVLAGPGSGKTRGKVAWLIKEKNVRPSSMVVVTFTNKAAKEMKERLEDPGLLGGSRTNLLRMGTFHSFCCRMLQRHLDWTPLKKGFGIADATKSKHLVELVFKELKPQLSKFGQTKKPAEFYGYISKAKNQGIDHVEYMATCGQEYTTRDTALIFKAYEEELESSNLVDFDGLLLFGRNLFKNYPASVNFVDQVLVDEFQDTNDLQYEILWHLTQRGRKALTVVGDPDQSIYGWRNANKENFDKMEADYKVTRVVDLKENYRSTKNIVRGAAYVVETDRKRKPRELFTNNHSGTPISVLRGSTELDEAAVVVAEIKRIIKYSNGLVKYKDIAILFRMNFLTLNFENALNHAKIPYVLVGGTRFLDRMEVKDILAYLSFFHNPRDVSAFIRMINVPKRGLGDVAIKKIQMTARMEQWTLLETMENLVAGHPQTASIRLMARSRSSLQSLLVLYNEVKEQIFRKDSPGKILRWIVDAIGYMEHLKGNYTKDFESRQANVEELITFANRSGENSGESDDESGTDYIGRFLESCTLSGDAKEHEEAKDGRISLITIHSAKGLEWPCVFIAGCESGLIPMSRAEDQTEESRVMYVAMTRAKCFLYCTLAAERKRWDGSQPTTLSPYLINLPESRFQKRTPAWNAEVRKWIAGMLRIPYEEDEKLRLENAGSYIYEEAESGYYDDYDDFDDYNDFNSFNDFGRLDRSCGYGNPRYTASVAPTKTSTQYPNPAPKAKSATTPLHKVKKEMAGAASAYSILRQQVKQEVKSEHPSAYDIKPNQRALDAALRDHNTGHTVKREGSSSSSSKMHSAKKRKSATPALDFDQCVSRGLQAVGTVKSSFSLDEAISAVKTQTQQNQYGESSADTIKNQTIGQLDKLVDGGSLVRVKKEDGFRYYVAE
ncbi:hypothetical protein [Absidia glauca]|uniref:DNA 3'-5' helicase n=1 Tax=Absidia glauca TaxID=4829 RepID=A0A163MD02_ABSGL|nr:hypothetical protein [Absidia glauca]